jgi:2-polyprenyl-3-methyl-5-hydroxy-6-metoxy-1,4-benzoquinol methylase
MFGKLFGRAAPSAALREDMAPARRTPQDGHDTIEIDQLDEAARIFEDPARHNELGQKTLRLPDWFNFELSPDRPEFREQQLRLWEAVTARTNYDIRINEDTPGAGDIDAWRRPAFYAAGDSHVAGEQVLAMGLILLRSNARPGSRVIEYGAGFGQNSVAFARLGATVDTVDINPGFCASIRTQAERFELDLTPHEAPFGFNPAGKDGAYDVVLFYESFHHCLDFASVIPAIEKMLAPGGKILLAGEPIFRGEQPYMPIAWGIRLDWQATAVMRIRGWMELGFREDFLTRQFMNSGFLWRHHAVPQAGPANLYEFTRWDTPVSMENWSLSLDEEAGWRAPEPGGRWARSNAVLRLPRHDGAVEIICRCHHDDGRFVTMTLGSETIQFALAQGERKTVRLPMRGLPDQDLKITTNNDRRQHEVDEDLGIFVEKLGPC